MRVGITIPVYVNNNNHLDFLNKTTMSFATKHTMVFCPVENRVADQYAPLQYHFTQHPNELYAIQGRQPQSVAKGWNDGIQKAIDAGCDYIFVFNEDIVLRRDAIDSLIDFALTHPEFVLWSMGQLPDLWSMDEAAIDENWSEHPNFSAYMVKNDFFYHVGTYDENIIPAYFEDSEFHGRLAMNNLKACVYGGSRFFHFGSRTTNSDPDLKEEMPPLFRKNQKYFMQKFGRMTTGEVDEMRKTYYEYPYGIEELNWKDKNTIPDYWQFVEKHGAESIQELPKEIVLAYLNEKRIIK